MKRTSNRGRFPTVLPSRSTSQASFASQQGEAATSDAGYAGDGEQDVPDHVLQPPAWLFLLGGLEILWAIISNGIQVTTSFTAMLGWQQSDMLTTLGLVKGAQAIILRSPAFALIALVIAVGSQIAIVITSQKISRQWKQRRVLEHESTKQALVEIVGTVDMATIFGYTGFIACAVSDYTYVSLYDFNPVIMIFWAILLACSSTYVLLDGIERVWSGVLAHRSWKLWQETLKAHYAQLAQRHYR